MELDITPKNLILSMLQASKSKAMPIKTLVQIGKLLGFTSNTIRVRTTRLLREGTIESDERGLYRISKKSSQISLYLERWRKGEDQVTDWNGKWLCFIPTSGKEQLMKSIVKRLDMLGFRKGLPGFWIRPDNLTLEFKKIKSLIEQHSSQHQGELFRAEGFSQKQISNWSRNLWPTKEIARIQDTIGSKLEDSFKRLSKMPTENALIESFLFGSQAIYALTMDPMLPGQMMNATSRIQLTEMMKSYDKLGKQLWSKQFSEISIHHSPIHLQLVS